MAPKSTTTVPASEEQQKEERNPRREESILAGRNLAYPPPGEEIVITGTAGRFPDSYDVNHFKENLYNKVDMISSDERRWLHEHPEIPVRGGKIFCADKFDAGFFGIHQHQVASMDPMCRQLLERAFEAVIDAGYHPSELEGTNTGVYVGSCVSETESIAFFINCYDDNYAITGCARSVLANRISYWLKINGPSFVTDTACSSSLYSFEQAFRDLREGKCEAALVCGSNLCLHPYVSLQFARLGVLSNDGRCKSFDNEANGYARSEGIAVVFLQKAKNARRIYARIIHAKTNCDGFKGQGITYPSGEVQKVLLEDFYEECKISPSSLSYMEAHGTGTIVGDPEELNTIDEVFCTGRDTPLLIGSVKSNIGHNEPVSGLCSIIKVIIGMENGYIPPNINFKTIREGVEGLEKKRMVVVSEKTPWQDNRGLVGINSFGFGGGNSHILLKWNEKLKVDGGLPKDDLPRLICCSGRIQNAVFAIFDEIISRPLDVEYVGLIHQAFKKHIPGHQYRGYTIVTKNGEIQRSEKYYEEELKPLVYVFGASDKKWASIGHQLFAIPKFAGTIQKIHEVYSKNGLPVNVTEIISSYKADNLAHYVIGTITVQLALVDILKELDVKPSKSLGYSLGVIPAFYSENRITLNEAVLSAFYTSLTLTEVIEKEEYNPDNVLKSKTGQHLLKYLKQVVREPRPSSSASCGGSQKALCEDLVEKLLTFKHDHIEKNVPKNSVVLEIGTGSSIKKPCDSTIIDTNRKTININLVDIGERDAVVSLLEGFGRLHEMGYDLQIYELYPKIEFPVSRSTPGISHLIKWNHEQSWYLMNYKEWVDQFFGYKNVFITVKDIEWGFLTGHVIDGRNLFPATGYLYVIWNLYASMLKKMIGECKVVMENIKFIRAVNIPKNGGINLMLTIQKNSGIFEVVEGDVAVVTGRIQLLDDDSELNFNEPLSSSENENDVPLAEKDIYKELRLRGYNYSGLFRGIKKCDNDSKIGYVEWKGNFTAFMDNMLQMKILQEDSRNLYVPTGINRIVIDPKKHLQQIETLGEDPLVPVHVSSETGIIRTKFIEIRGLSASPIARKKQMGEPVLETYKFVPNITTLSLEQSARVNVQLALDNVMSVKVKVVEVPPEDVSEDYSYLSPLILTALGDLPLMQPEISLLSKKPVDISGVAVDYKELKSESNCLMVVLDNVSKKSTEELEEALAVLRENGMIISREALDAEPVFQDSVHVLTAHTTPKEKIFMLKKKSPNKKRTIIDISKDHTNFNWLPALQEAMKSEEEILLLAQNDKNSGILGLVNCIRREPTGEKVKAIFVQDENAPKFFLNNELFSKQIEKGFAVSVYKDGQWGTYRHLLLPENPQVEVDHSYAIIGTPGDLSTLKWIEGPMKRDSEVSSENDIISIYYASLNFRDIMTASGRISVDVITRDRTKQMCVQGFEYSGRNRKGERVFGMVSSGSLASICVSDNYMQIPLPDHWTMVDAATVPCVYSTVLIALIETARLKNGESILIHAGTGGIGQAAINVALHYGCTIFTTVGSKEKKDFIRKHFPQIRESHIGNSRDTSFEQMVMYHTKGRGVDLVLNSLAEEKLQASVRCLAKGGRFIEIGKFDLANDNQLSLQVFEKGASFHSVMLDMTMETDPHFKKRLFKLLVEAIRIGAVKPLQYTLFKEEELEQAFRYMASGKHMGKVVLKMRNEEEQKVLLPEQHLFKCHPRYYCHPEKTIIIVGGLGGFGLELADWLVLRGARKLILTSRKGVSTGYQSMRIRTWNSYGVDVVVSTEDVTKKEDCVTLLKKANEMGPVQAIFNLGVVLKDAILENQNVENFKISHAPKAYATEYLDELTRKMCPELRDFVIFSSVSCGRGNAGQTNYGMANSIMERICEARKRDGLPALAIEWGAVGDVGLVAEMQESNTELVIGGTLQQRITSCLNVMDTFLRQDEPIVSSMVVAEKRGGSGSFDNAIDAVATILGLRDLKIVSPHQTLPELGMDSIMAVEIKQILESEYEIVLTPQEIRSMTFARIQEMEREKESGDSKKKDSQQAAVNTFGLFINNIGPSSAEVANLQYVKMKTTVEDDETAPTALLIPGIEGYATVFEPLAAHLKMNMICLQYRFDGNTQNIPVIARKLFPVAKELIGPSKRFNIIGYSYGVVVTLELIHLLEEEGYTGRAAFIDGSPDIMKEVCQKNLVYDSDATFDTSVLCGVLSLYVSHKDIEEAKIKMLLCSSYEERFEVGVQYVPKDFPWPIEFLKELARSFYERVKSLNAYVKTFNKVETPIMLIRPKTGLIRDFEDDYKLSNYCSNIKDVFSIDGDHVTVLKNSESSEKLLKFFIDEA